MGCPHRYYKRALQCFAHALVYMEDEKQAKELLNEKSEEKLEEFILDKKKTYNEKQFYYDAGRTTEFVLNEADEEGNDAFNACIGGLNEFGDFIGLKRKENSDITMTQNEKKDAIEYIKAQLEDGFINLGCHDENEIEIVRQAINMYEKLPCIKLVDDYDKELFINGESVCCHKHLYPADVLDALDEAGIINFTHER